MKTALRLVGLDSGPIGLLTHPKPSQEAVACLDWLKNLARRQVVVALPSVIEYEIRREYLLRRNAVGLEKLDFLKTTLKWLPIHDDVFVSAAGIWSEIRQKGRPTAPPKALDVDCILVAQLRLYVASHDIASDEWVVATSDVSDLSNLAPSNHWSNIRVDLED